MCGKRFYGKADLLADDDEIIFNNAIMSKIFNTKYGEPSDWEDLAEVKPGVKGDEGAPTAAVATEGDDSDDVK